MFISQAALDDKKKAEEQKNEVEPPAVPLLPTGRKLHEAISHRNDDESPRNDAVIYLEPMQIKSFFVQLVPKRVCKPAFLSFLSIFPFHFFFFFLSFYLFFSFY